MSDASSALLAQVREAKETARSFNIVGGASKPIGPVLGEGVSTLEHSGVINYDPTELVISVRAGTRLDELVEVLAEQNQMLPFEPPMFDGGTIGGVLACGLSGPRRPWAGAARDYVLGTRIINGLGQDLSFGGEVIR